MDHKPTLTSDRYQEKVVLILKLNYYSSITMMVFAGICYYSLHIKQVIPQTIFAYGALNLINTLLFHKHKNLHISYLISSSLGIIGSIIASLYSGGINSPFIFTLMLIAFAGYVSTRNYGKFHLYLILVIILLIYFHGYLGLSFPTVVPSESENLYSLLVILFNIYVLGDIFGKMLLGNYNKLYQSKREIEKKNYEKELLLKEIHHRVKNNLQTISSLLNMQARTTENVETRRILTSSHNRVLSMAMVHEMLYARDDLSRIEYKDYVLHLGEFLIKSLNKEDKEIDLNINVNNIKFNIDTAIPLGLLISEFITNSLKHAFLKKKKGTITIVIEKPDPEYFLLTYSDNGIGFNASILENKTESMGIKLIQNLTRQLRGTLKKVNSKNGATYLIKFKEI